MKNKIKTRKKKGVRSTTDKISLREKLVRAKGQLQFKVDQLKKRIFYRTVSRLLTWAEL